MLRCNYEVKCFNTSSQQKNNIPSHINAVKENLIRYKVTIKLGFPEQADALVELFF